MTQRRITNYEAVRVVATRVSQLEQGASYYVNTMPGDTAECIAIIEFLAGEIPMIIQRTLPDGTVDSLKMSCMSMSEGIQNEYISRLQQLRADNKRYLQS